MIENSLPDPWHFPREAAGSVVETLASGLLRLEREGFLERAMRGGYAIADPMVRIWLERVRRS